MSLRVLWREHPPAVTDSTAVGQYLTKYWQKVEVAHAKRASEVDMMLRTKEVTKEMTASEKKVNLKEFFFFSFVSIKFRITAITF